MGDGRIFFIRWGRGWERALIPIAATYHFSIAEMLEMTADDIAFWLKGLEDLYGKRR